MNPYLSSQQESFTNILEFFKREIATLRSGRANPSVLDNVQVEAYDTKNPLNTVANISVSDSRSLIVTPWDKALAKAIEKAIIEADLGLGVVNEGEHVRLSVPALTEENRKDTVKKLNEKLEKTRISLRQEREEVKKKIDQAGADKEISEDDKFRYIKELDEFVASKNEELKSIRDRKEQDLMEV